jgi:hypothetical protein
MHAMEEKHDKEEKGDNVFEVLSSLKQRKQFLLEGEPSSVAHKLCKRVQTHGARASRFVFSQETSRHWVLPFDSITTQEVHRVLSDLTLTCSNPSPDMLVELDVSIETPYPEWALWAQPTSTSHKQGGEGAQPPADPLVQELQRYVFQDSKDPRRPVHDRRLFSEKLATQKTRTVFAGEFACVLVGEQWFLPPDKAPQAQVDQRLTPLFVLAPGERAFLLANVSDGQSDEPRVHAFFKPSFLVTPVSEKPLTAQQALAVWRACQSRADFDGTNVFELADIEDLFLACSSASRSKKSFIRVVAPHACTKCDHPHCRRLFHVEPKKHAFHVTVESEGQTPTEIMKGVLAQPLD